jgi:hypothetical protein
MMETRAAVPGRAGEQGVGVAGEEPTVLDHQAGIVGGLADIDPALLPRGGNEINGGQADSQGGGGAARSTGAQDFRASGGQRDGGQQVAGHHAERCVREPCAGHHQRQQSTASRPMRA